MASLFLAFEAPQGSWDLLLNSFKTVADLHPVVSTGLIKCQDVSVGLDSLFTSSHGDSFYMCNSLFFPRADAIFSSVANVNSLLLMTPLEVLSFSCGCALHLVV